MSEHNRYYHLKHTGFGASRKFEKYIQLQFLENVPDKNNT